MSKVWAVITGAVDKLYNAFSPLNDLEKYLAGSYDIFEVERRERKFWNRYY